MTLTTEPKARAGIAADPAACNALPATSTQKLGAGAHTRGPAANTTKASEKVFLIGVKDFEYIFPL